MAFELYVVESANQMNTLLINAELNPEQQSEQIVEAAVIGCRTLKQLVDDKDFRGTVERMADPRLGKERRMAVEFRTIIEDVDRFDHFLCLEREVLVKGGLVQDLADKLID